MEPITYIFSAAVIMFAIVIGLLLARYEKQKKEIDDLKKQRSLIEFQARQKSVRLLEDAREKGLRIILDATERAGRDQKDIASELTKVAAEQQEIYKQVLHNISKTVGDKALREINNLSDILEQETTGVQKLVSKKLEEEYQRISDEIDAYKLAKINELNLKLRDMVSDISRNVVGKGLSQDEHVELLIRSLVEMKQKYGL